MPSFLAILSILLTILLAILSILLTILGPFHAALNTILFTILTIRTALMPGTAKRGLLGGEAVTLGFQVIEAGGGGAVERPGSLQAHLESRVLLTRMNHHTIPGNLTLSEQVDTLFVNQGRRIPVPVGRSIGGILPPRLLTIGAIHDDNGGDAIRCRILMKHRGTPRSLDDLVCRSLSLNRRSRNSALSSTTVLGLDGVDFPVQTLASGFEFRKFSNYIGSLRLLLGKLGDFLVKSLHTGELANGEPWAETKDTSTVILKRLVSVLIEEVEVE
jgi:hypothetical protein